VLLIPKVSLLELVEQEFLLLWNRLTEIRLDNGHENNTGVEEPPRCWDRKPATDPASSSPAISARQSSLSCAAVISDPVHGRDEGVPQLAGVPVMDRGQGQG